MRRHFHKAALIISSYFLVAVPAFAYNPPAGASIVPLLGSPQALSSGPTVTALEAPWADRLNPAASAEAQRPILDAGYSLISDFGTEGAGHALGLGLTLPLPYGVWGAGLRLVTIPDSMSSLPLGTFAEFRGGIGKDLFPDLFVGASFDLTLGSNKGFGWGAGLTLGILHTLGDLGFLKDFRWGAVLSDIGKGYSTSASQGNLDSTAPSSSYPAAFTLSGGARATIFKNEDWNLGVGLDISLPSFQDFGLNAQTVLAYKNMARLNLGWGLLVRELAASGSLAKSFVPSIGLSAVIPIERKSDDSFVSRQGWDSSELKPAVSFTPLYGKLVAIGAGASIPLGVLDRNPPKITVRFPSSSYGPYYLSPNSDGVTDLLEIPLAITDQRYLVSYSLSIYRGDPGAGAIVRTIANKESRPETQGFSGLWERLVYIKKGVPVPDKLVWNGVADSGAVVPDGQYSIVIEAVDDNGNRGKAGPFAFIIDATAPKAELAAAETSRLFSPDGDGNRDSILFKLSGSVEDLWSARIFDATARAIRTYEWKNSAPADFSWDGRGEDGIVVADGVYSLVVEAKDRGGNTASARIDNILVNTQQPPINVAIDVSSFSPNGDGIRDRVALIPSVPVRVGLASWRLSVVDKAGREVWALTGSDSGSLKERFEYDGRGADLKYQAEGQYQAKLGVTYVNGYSPSALSPIFVLDATPPSATVSANRSAFNPAGAAGQDLFVITQKGSKEDRWTGEMLGAGGTPVRTWNFGPMPDARLEWDGTNDAGSPVPDGVYTYRLRTQDRAGNSFASAPVSVALDTEKKAVRLTVDQRAFSPNGDGTKDAIRINAVVERNDLVRSWELAVLPAESAGTASVRSWKGERGIPESFLWDGARDSGAKDSGGRASDGRYLARLKVDYLNDDVAEATTTVFVIDTAPPSVSVSIAPLLFSPNGDGRQDSTRIEQSSKPGDDWEGRIFASDGSTVRSYSWKNGVESVAWDGTDEAGNRVKDGIYRYDISASDAAGNRFSTSVVGIKVDARSAQVFVTASATGLSPNGDGFMDDIAFSTIVNLKEGVTAWKFSLVDKSGTERASFSGSSGEVPSRIVWDGKDASGQILTGEYYGILSVDYDKGDRASAKTGTIAVDIAAPSVELRLSPDFFSPDNDGVSDELTISISVNDASPVEEWRFEIDEVAVEEILGAKPRERHFISWTGKGAPAKKIVWDGRSAKGELVEAATDYPFYFTIKDVYGNLTRMTGLIAVDVLVIRDQDRLKIKVPSIVFRPNYADFVNLSPDQVERNIRVIRRIAEILNKFRDYRIRIEGHGNNVGKILADAQSRIVEEEDKELMPLSEARAELVRKLLADNGVDAKRLSTLGRGSSEPVVDFKDAENRWKNRRVEFILIKNQ